MKNFNSNRVQIPSIIFVECHWLYIISENLIFVGCYYFYQAENNVHRSNSVCIYYQCGLQNTLSTVLLKLFLNVINEPCFDILRTKEQLGIEIESNILLVFDYFDLHNLYFKKIFFLKQDTLYTVVSVEHVESRDWKL